MLPPRPMRLAPFLRFAVPFGVLAALLALPAHAQDAPAAIDSIAAAQPVMGRPFVLDLPAGTDTVFVTYRPGSSVAVADTLFAGGASTLSWAPRRAGVVRVEAGGITRNLSVRFDEPPLFGVAIMLLAGLILFGGATYATVKLFSEGPPDTRPERRPDT